RPRDRHGRIRPVDQEGLGVTAGLVVCVAGEAGGGGGRAGVGVRRVGDGEGLVEAAGAGDVGAAWCLGRAVVGDADRTRDCRRGGRLVDQEGLGVTAGLVVCVAGEAGGGGGRAGVGVRRVGDGEGLVEAAGAGDVGAAWCLGRAVVGDADRTRDCRRGGRLVDQEGLGVTAGLVVCVAGEAGGGGGRAGVGVRRVGDGEGVVEAAGAGDVGAAWCLGRAVVGDADRTRECRRGGRLVDQEGLGVTAGLVVCVAGEAGGGGGRAGVGVRRVGDGEGLVEAAGAGDVGAAWCLGRAVVGDADRPRDCRRGGRLVDQEGLGV